jgi:hypothetical protein
LIDTASNYVDGRSEELVGTVLEKTGARAFVVTKVGYISPAAASALQRAGVPSDRLPLLKSGTPFSLDPAVLSVLLDLSRARLRRPTLDAVLLHNPERLTQTGASTDALHTALERAFTFLDQEVGASRLRFYGVSSNCLPSAAEGDPLDLETLLELAPPDRSPRLGFVQFPLNLLERDAATASARSSLLARVPHGVRTITNRPLNALVDGVMVRLALATTQAGNDDAWQTCVGLVSARLELLDRAEPWTSFRPMQFLRDSRNDIPDPGLVDAIWARQIAPFVATLFDGDAGREARDAFEQLRFHARANAQAVLSQTTRAALARLVREGLLDRSSTEPLAITACRYCLDAGADHILVGMRRPEYVVELAPLFAHVARPRSPDPGLPAR